MINETPRAYVDDIKKNSDYIGMFSDKKKCSEWIRDNIEDTDVPPISFIYDGEPSDRLPWKKTVSDKETVTDYENDRPQKRCFYTVSYTACGLEVEVKVITYPKYPMIVEYEASLKNMSGCNSGVVKNLLSIDSNIYNGADVAELHSFRGVNYLETEYEPMLDKIYAGVKESEKHFEVTNGKPTHTYLQNFNTEFPSLNGGVISVLSWQSNWKTDFSLNRKGEYRFSCGEYGTNFVLTDEEKVRLPAIVLLFYKGDFQCGQNLWRRWFAECNLLRYGGKRFGEYILACLSGNAYADVGAINLLNRSCVRPYVTYTEQDAAWYECPPNDWESVGTWHWDEKRYPGGIKDVADASHKAGLPFSLWFEPERVSYGTKTFKDLREDGQIIALKNGFQFAAIPDENGKPQLLKYDEIPDTNKYNLVNYAMPGVAEYMLEVVDNVIAESGVDIYRQDFNMEPGAYWDAYDEKMSREMGIPRYGLTGEKHGTAYLWFLGELVRRHPGMMMDICASGGMRYDLESARYGFMHTRTDWFRRVNASQVHTYTLAQWCTVVGTGVLDPNNKYEVHSKITPGIGIGCYAEPRASIDFTVFDWYPNSLRPLSESEQAVLDTYEKSLPYIKEKQEEAKYALYEDFYVLSGAELGDEGIVSYEFNSPDNGGLLAVYFRCAGDCKIVMRGLCSKSEYELDVDGAEEKKVFTGLQLMTEGLVFDSDAQKAIIVKYRRIS